MLIQSHVVVSLSHQASVKLNSVHQIRYTSYIHSIYYHAIQCYHAIVCYHTSNRVVKKRGKQITKQYILLLSVHVTCVTLTSYHKLDAAMSYKQPHLYLH
jgi:hypothetical protein